MTEIKELTLSVETKDKMNLEKMLHFVQCLQKNQKVHEGIPQIRIEINGLDKTLSLKEAIFSMKNVS